MMHILAFVTLAGIQAAQLPIDGQLKGSRSLAAGNIRDDVNKGVASFSLKAPGKAPGAAAAAAAKKGADVTQQPVAVQIDESVLKKLNKQLSPKCSERYSAMMAGEGPALHSFNRHAGDDATTNQCENDLQGKVCHTDAQIAENVNAPDGRKLSQVLQVEGHSCLPKECTEQSDLQALASFMHAQTKEMMPGEATKVQLNVDCAKSGGGNVVVGATGQKEELPKKSSSFMTTPLLAFALMLLMRA